MNDLWVDYLKQYDVINKDEIKCSDERLKLVEIL